MRRLLRPLLPFVAVPFLAGQASAQAAPDPAPNTVTVFGSGEARAVPDVATAVFSVRKESKSSRDALDASNKTMTALVNGLKDLGIEARDLRTSGFGVAPQYCYDTGKGGQRLPPAVVGYEVTNGLSIRVRDLGRLDEVLDRAVTLGATSSDNVSFEIADPAALRIEARRKAMEDAKANATALAEIAGVPLGKALRIDLSRPYAPSYPFQDYYNQTQGYQAMNMQARPAAPVPSVPIETGDQTVSAEVTVVFALGGPER